MKILDISLSDKEELNSLISLYKEVFKKDLEPEEILWRYTENPEIEAGFNTNTVIKSENKILAHTAVTPKNFEISKYTIRGCLSGGSMVGKKAHGAFPIIFDHMIKRLKDNKFDFVYAFPNEQSAPFLIKYFGFNEGFMAYLALRHDDLKENLSPHEICFQNKIKKTK